MIYSNHPPWLLWLQVIPLRGYQDRLAAYIRIGDHENICGLQDVVIGQDSVYVFLPGHHGDMHAYVRSRKRLGEEEAQLLFTQVLNAVTHCHQRGVVLRDLKLRRFVFTDEHRWDWVLLLQYCNTTLIHTGETEYYRCCKYTVCVFLQDSSRPAWPQWLHPPAR